MLGPFDLSFHPIEVPGLVAETENVQDERDFPIYFVSKCEKLVELYHSPSVRRRIVGE